MMLLLLLLAAAAAVQRRGLKKGRLGCCLAYLNLIQNVCTMHAQGQLCPPAMARLCYWTIFDHVTYHSCPLARSRYSEADKEEQAW